MSGVRRIDELAAAGQLQFLVEYQRGSVLDRSPSPLAAPTVGNSPQWMESPKGSGILFPTGSTACIDYGAAAKCDTTTGGSVWVVANFVQYSAANGVLFRKMNWGFGVNGYVMYLNGATLLQFGLADAAGLQVSTRNVSNFVMGKPVFLAMTWNGTRFRCFQDGVRWSDVAQTKIPTPVGQALRIGNEGVGVANPFGNSVLLAGISTTALSDSDIARIYTDWLQSYYAKNLARRGFVYKYPSKNAAEYAAAGIVWDTGEALGADGKTVDYTNNYPGTKVNCPVPANDSLFQGCGTTCDGGLDWINHGNMSQLNGLTELSFSGWVGFPPGNISASGWWLYINAAGVFFTLGHALAASPTGPFFCYMGAGIIRTTSTVLRAGTKQHLAFTYAAGAGVLYVDGESYPLTITAPLPAVLPNFSASPMRVGTVIKIEAHQARGQTRTLTPDQMRAEYLEGAKHLVLRETLEDVPVSLVAAVGAGGKIGPWDVISGSFKCSETSDGKRWLEIVAAGDAVLPILDCSFVTHDFYVYKHQLVSDTRLVLGTSRSPVGTALAGSNGYCTILDDLRRVRMSRYTAGIIDANLWVTGNNFYAMDTTYRFTVARRVSDGRFQQWIKGGAYTDFTTTGGPAADATYTGLVWLHFQGGAGDKLCLYDPRDPTVALNVFAGAISPTLGEVPGSVLLNILGMSNQFTLPPWSDSGGATITVTDGVYASPGGTPGHAARLDILAGGGAAFITQINTTSATAQYTASIYVRAVVGNTCTVDFWNTVNTYSVQANLTTGVLTPAATAFGNPYCWAEDAGGGWWRICWSVIAGTATLEMTIHGDNAGDVLAVDQAQLVQGPCAGRYRETQ